MTNQAISQGEIEVKGSSNRYTTSNNPSIAAPNLQTGYMVKRRPEPFDKLQRYADIIGLINNMQGQYKDMAKTLQDQLDELNKRLANMENFVRYLDETKEACKNRSEVY